MEFFKLIKKGWNFRNHRMKPIVGFRVVLTSVIVQATICQVIA